MWNIRTGHNLLCRFSRSRAGDGISAATGLPSALPNFPHPAVSSTLHPSRNRCRFRSLLVYVLFIGILSSARAASTDWAEVHNETIRGIQQLYNMDVDAALLTFSRVSSLAPGDPRGYFFQSMAHFYRYNLQRDEKDLDRFFALSDTVIDVCERILDANDNDAAAHFYLGGIYGYRGLGYQSRGSMMKAVYAGRKGYMELEEAVEKDPRLYDAQMGLGLFHYLLAKVPRSLSWILKIAGFDGDLEGGLASLKLAAEKGIYARTEAMFFLAQFNFNEHKPDEAFKWISELQKQFPNNTLFLLTEANWRRIQGQLDEAESVTRRAIALNEKQSIKYGEEFAFSTLAGILFAKNDFPGALASYDTYFAKVVNRALVTNYIIYRYGVTQEVLGNRSKAVEIYRMARPPADKENHWDESYYQRALRRLQYPLPPAGILLVKASNESGQHHWDAASALYEQALQQAGDTVDVQAQALYGLQQVYFEQEKYAESAQYGQRVVGLTPAVETWVPPSSWLLLGRAKAKLGDKDGAKAAFKKVKDYDGYDFQSRVEDQADEELDKL